MYSFILVEIKKSDEEATCIFVSSFIRQNRLGLCTPSRLNLFARELVAFRTEHEEWVFSNIRDS